MSKNPTYQKFINSIRRNPRLKTKTKKEYIRIFKSIPASLLSRKNCGVFRDFLEEKSKKTIALYLSVYRRYMRFCGYRFEDIIYYTHESGVKLKDSFSEKEIFRIVRDSDLFMKSLILILYLTGLRISELLGSSLEESNCYLVISFLGKGKTNQEKIFIRKEKNTLNAALREFYKGKYIYRRKYYPIWKTFKKTMLRNGIDSPRLTLHSIRHSAANRFRRLYGEHKAMMLLRHKDFRTTEIYLDSSEIYL